MTVTLRSIGNPRPEALRSEAASAVPTTRAPIGCPGLERQIHRRHRSPVGSAGVDAVPPIDRLPNHSALRLSCGDAPGWMRR